MMEPKLRTASKLKPPYAINQFPKNFINIFAENIVYMIATKNTMSIEGDEWEQIFAECVGAQWKPSNIGLDDVRLGNCCWSAKTVKGAGNLGKQKTVRLISGRNSPTYSYGEDRITEEKPDVIGRMVLDIWNTRVSNIRQYFEFARTIVLVKGGDYTDYLIFETETVRYDWEQYEFSWNKNNNLIGKEKQSGKHKFTWQPHGSQFTIIEDIPPTRLHLKVRKPDKLNKEKVLSNVGFNEQWVTIINDNK